jgi:hypothetical protein
MNLRSLLSVTVVAVVLWAARDALGMIVTLGWNGAFTLPQFYSWPEFFIGQAVCCVLFLVATVLLFCCRRRFIAWLRLPAGWSLDSAVGAPQVIFAAFMFLDGVFIADAVDGIFMRWLESAPQRGNTSLGYNIGLFIQCAAYAAAGVSMLFRPAFWFRIAYENSTNVAE